MLQVAVGVIANEHGDVLVALRHAHLHQGGLWEFPGGKVATGETVEAALRRELQEELDIRVRRAEPLLVVEHEYPDRAVRLEVWRVLAFDGAARGCEGQQLRWLPVTALDPLLFPAANRPIIEALRRESGPRFP